MRMNTLQKFLRVFGFPIASNYYLKRAISLLGFFYRKTFSFESIWKRGFLWGKASSVIRKRVKMLWWQQIYEAMFKLHGKLNMAVGGLSHSLAYEALRHWGWFKGLLFKKRIFWRNPLGCHGKNIKHFAETETPRNKTKNIFEETGNTEDNFAHTRNSSNYWTKTDVFIKNK